MKKVKGMHDKKNKYCPKNQVFDGEYGKACLCGMPAVEPDILLSRPIQKKRRKR